MKRHIATFAGSVVICIAVAVLFLMREKGLTAGGARRVRR
jgi:hypothetical protein